MSMIQQRPCATGTDIEQITQFLLDSYALTGDLTNWPPRRWIGSIYHSNDTDQQAKRERLSQIVRIWHDSEGQIVGVVIPEYDGGVFLQIHPDYRDVEGEMLDWAETHLAQRAEDGTRWLEVHAYEDDLQRVQRLTGRGYVLREPYEITRHRDMRVPVPDYSVPDGYCIRNMMNTADDWQRQAELLNSAFRRTFHNAEEYRNFMQAPCYQAELDIVVIAPDGQFAANAGLMMHEAQSFAVVEPVCTHPDHQGKGLASAAIAEGLRRLQPFQIADAYIDVWSENPTARHVYQKMGFTDVRNLRRFRATLQEK